MKNLYLNIIGKYIGSFFTFCFIILSISLQAQTMPVKAWDKTIGANNLDVLLTAHQTTDGGYILGGWSNSGASGDKSQTSRGLKDYWVVKLDAVGNKTWDKTFGGAGQDTLTAIKQTADGGYILGGKSNSNQSGDKSQNSKGTYDYWVIKLDATGNKIWDKTFGGNNIDDLEALQQTNDGGYIVGGFSASGISGDKTQASKGQEDYWIIKLDANGNKLWDKTIGGPSIDELEDLQQTNDGGYILGGRSFSNQGGDKSQSSYGWSDYWVVKTDSVGNKIWDSTFGGPEMEYFYDLQQSNDGGYILVGYQYIPIPSSTSLEINYWVVKIDSTGTKQWDKNFGGSNFDLLYSVQQTTDGGYIFGGGSASNQSVDKSQASLGLYDFWVLKTDGLGNKLWDKTMGGSNLETILSIQQTSDGGFFAAGHSSSSISIDKSENSKGGVDYWVLKLLPVPAIHTNFGGTFCAGSTITIPFTLTGTFNAGNIFTAQLSDANGSFANPIPIGTLNSITASSIVGTIPSGLIAGTQYRVRVIASNLATIGSASLNTITIENAPLPTVISAMRCGNGAIDLEAAGAPAGGHYQWYTSATGTTAIAGATSAIYTTPNLSSTTIYYVTTVTALGCESATRVAATATVNTIPASPVVSVAERCGNGTLTLTASGTPAGGSYNWYTAANGGTAINNSGVFTTPSLNITTAYYVTTVSPSGCESVLRIPVVATINPMPDKPVITFINGVLSSNISTNIQWYRNDTLLTGANEKEYVPTVSGNYFVKAILGNCISSSEKYLFIIPESNCDVNFNIYPNPNTGKFKIKYDGCKKPVSITVFNSIGQKINDSIKIEDFDNTQGAEIDATALSKGLYILELKTEKKTTYFKIVIE